eukprot:TRINITY_DN687_c0_g1_i6.p1 TRINITY_DN687_c0_g1~~TRINITY_DN687_c0_g1_i6.p1  ORF type:complete len:495 (-),score=98.96 TRINITY_DN687_c0_g1_i6:690-2174(-)
MASTGRQEERAELPRKALNAQPNVSMFIAICTAMAGALMFGFDQSNFGQVHSFESFREAWCVGKYGAPQSCREDPEHNGPWQHDFVTWGGSLITFGAAMGGLVLGPLLASACGRRLCISAGAFICVIGCLLASYMSFSTVPMFMVGRVLTGFGIGVACYALPMYSSEIATPSVRGTMGSLFQVFTVFGGFVATVITMTDHDWELGMMLPGIVGAIVGTFIWLTPESPRFIMQKKGKDAGADVLQKVRTGDISAEAQQIDAELTAEKATEQVTYLSLVTEPGLRKRVFIACWLQVAQQLTGVNAFLFYATTLFKDVGVDNPYVFNTVFQGVMFVGCVLGSWLVDSAYGGRRIQLLGATSVMGPALLVGGFSLAFNWPGFITILMLLIYAFGFQIAWGAIPWVYPSEIFSMAEREKAMSLAVFFQYGINAVIAFITPGMLQWSGPGTLFVFAGLNILNFAFVWMCIKETKGVPLEEIPGLFKSDLKNVQEADSNDA